MVQVQLKEIDLLPQINYRGISTKTIKEILKPFSISFSVENVSRATTHEICESLDSYTQQSMRYVKMGSDAFIVPPHFSSGLKKEFERVNNFLLENYEKLSVLKDEFKNETGRPKPNWFKFAPIEDNRYALSLASPSNILVTMSADKLLNFFGSLSRTFESEDIYHAIAPHLPLSLADLCYEQLGSKNFFAIAQIHANKLNKAIEEGVYIDILPNRMNRAGLGALTSTNALTPSEIFNSYLNEDLRNKELSAVAKRVMGYGHESVIEHARVGLGIAMSLVNYHQYERHRLPSNVRESFTDIPLDRIVVLPPKIAMNEEGAELFYSSVKEAQDLREKIMNEDLNSNHYALLNGTLIGVYSNMNARAFLQMAGERLCNNVQWENQGLFEGMALLLRVAEPILYKGAAPKCVTLKKCPEGKLSCGRFNEVQEKYRT